MVKTDNELFSIEDYSSQLAAGCDVVPIYAASKPLKAEDLPPMVRNDVHVSPRWCSCIACFPLAALGSGAYPVVSCAACLTDLLCLQQVAEGFRLVEADPKAGHDPLPTSVISKLGLMDWREVPCHCALDTSSTWRLLSTAATASKRQLENGRLKFVMMLLQALRAVHFPANMSAAEAGRRRLAFDELFLLQLKLLLKRALQRCTTGRLRPLLVLLLEDSATTIPQMPYDVCACRPGPVAACILLGTVLQGAV